MKYQRHTEETRITLEFEPRGCGERRIDSGIGFLDHMLGTLAFHARFDLALQAEADLHVDDHHAAEDCALALGTALDQSLGDRRAITRFGSAYAPLDEALARAVVDISGRPGACIDLGLTREALGGLACENIPHFFRSFATAARLTLHVDVLRGENDHHRAEAAFKALALALRAALAPQRDGIPSLKGTLS
ncbi:MAG: imidazoleglycerol-phosphate dehydratase HisB [Planctomycetota bacterium]